MRKNDYITEAEANRYKAEPLGLTYNLITYSEGPAPYLIEKLRPFLQDWCDNHQKEDQTSYNLFTDGLKIRTTIDFDMQIAAENAVADQIDIGFVTQVQGQILNLKAIFHGFIDG